MEVIATAEKPWESAASLNVRGGTIYRKPLAEGELLPGVGFTAALLRFGDHGAPDEARVTPRHRHDFEQFRMAVTGTEEFAPGLVCEEGWVSYFPAGAYYGPQKMIGECLQIQWSDAWVTKAQHAAAIVELSRTGTFREGRYHYTDKQGDERDKDAINAIWEHVYQREAESKFPLPRYPQPILMNPVAFSWQPGPDNVQVKSLGHFTERDLYVQMIRWSGEGSFVLTQERSQLLFTFEGSVRVGDLFGGPQTSVWSPVGEEVAIDGTDVVAIVFGFAVQPG